MSLKEKQMNSNEVAIVIPSLNPGAELPDLIHCIRLRCSNPIILVDDGSAPEHRSFFEAAQQESHVTLLTHCVNLGKGRALKSAFNYYLNQWGDGPGVVTADADGQHTPEDIVKCIEILTENPHALVLGCRNFSGDEVPWKSKLGNNLATAMFKYLLNLEISDTQTGLRGIPSDFMRVLMNKKGERFEFETLMLLATKGPESSHPIHEVEIETVYLNGNRQTHFSPVRDSVKICRIIFASLLQTFLLFSLSGVLAAIIDQGVFALLYYWVFPMLEVAPLLGAVLLARLLSLGFNYLFNRNIVFNRDKKLLDRRTLAEYLLLCAVVLGLAYGLLWVGHRYLPWMNVLVLKIGIDALLFLLSFRIQNRVIFK